LENDKTIIKEDFPSQKKFLQMLRKFENGCEKFSLKKLKSLGVKASKTYENLGSLQSLLYRYACCYWGCKTDDHKFERTIGRVVSHCQASIRVLGFGYYDESLALTRNISEIANLIALFNYDATAFAEWKTLDEQTAWEKYGPAKVRKKIEQLNGIVPIAKEHYGRLCTIGTHLNPSTSPQSFNIDKIPTVGAFFQELGFIVALNELALSMGIVGGGTFKLGTIDKSIKNEIKNASIKLVKESGSITTDNLQTVWDDVIKSRGNK
jgi:hypothetical protein